MTQINLDDPADIWTIDGSLNTLSDRPGMDSQKTNAYGIKFFHITEDFEFQSLTSMTDTDVVLSYDADWGNPSTHLPYIYDYFSETLRFRETFSQEFRLLSNKADFNSNKRYEWVVGMNFFESNEKNLKKDDGIYGDPSDPYSPYVSESSSSSKFDIENFSIYGNLNYLINESTKASMGLRWENSESKYSDSFGESFNPSDKISGGKISVNKILDKRSFKIFKIETKLAIKNFYPTTKICQWFLDKMDNKTWKVNKNRFIKKIPFLEASFCTTHPSSLKKINSKNLYFIPNPVDETFENLELYKKNHHKYDLFFALSHGVHRGTLKKGKTDNREIFLNKLINSSNEIRFNIFGIKDNQPIWAENFKNELSKSKMALNLSQGEPLKFYSSDRISQLIGNGILTFIDRKTKLNKIFKNDEVIFYSGVKDLTKKIIKYKNSESLRNKIAKKGMLKYHKYMNSKLVAEFMINKSFNINYKKKFFWENK